MDDVLARIVARKRVEVADRLGDRTIAAAPTRRSLAAALARPGARFIMEIKPRSPSGHVARHQPAAALAAYRPVADAISILTDEADFGGSLDLLATLRKDYGGPILAKDFIVDPRQVDEVRAAGADAVLAMLSVLDDATARAVMARAARFDMDVLVEVHDATELDRALGLGARLVGINNRNLKTLTTDLAVTEALAPRVPHDVVLVSESGIASHADAQRLARHVDGFLVGSALMAADDIALAARQLVHGPVKLCGMTRVADVALAARQGASHVGFIFVPGTPRAIDVERARTLTMMAGQFGMQTVGVFRGQPPEEIAAASRALRLDVVQLHEPGAGAKIGALRPHLRAGTECWALAGVEGTAIDAVPQADRTLFDTRIGTRSGGTGVAFDWRRIAGRDDLTRAFLAGGIGPDNVRAAARAGAYGLDICSGVEAAPGTKDPAKVEALFAALRHPDRRSGQ
ncbi:bifunctional indole-3-glycerol-phosphate synthase TrpC/phosphoribosylanthranilate isomerase TrpF [Sphingomicrobium astaxanthinifaciens]|uniref:bifunctional indole-3-glycerol-phosphate synthase TrpC/phosphoribosylanthranilate isomerase TrpF n=1 Tax=Sphingomicrobium astaxanthinifaciens TaxID=1227949 RepID=UPI001FCBB0B2|nr:bifunctional indole-3-glycerol-phosphate synthase TrpC/phosphoribosylanthranilate isomerase TrpF [Sphingomicrobium astaxanthinifaciens]MCJ7421200.1 bifunctional indole-3-glycerol-phosphate synthase TrpC/phosphoribosylanthranilate isomerase TrpF [Sphingomicrobium astaxanthinifaciens]